MERITDDTIVVVPEGSGQPTGFPRGTVVDVEEIEGDESRWRLLKEIDYRGNRQEFQVPVGETTDFASVPKLFVWFLPRYGKYTKAAVLHDHLWSKEIEKGTITRLEADGLFRQAMRELGVAFLRRWIMWAAVRWGALTKKDARKDWWKESWRVLLVSLPALPIVLPPAILIAISLIAFYVIELVVFLPLRLVRAVKLARRKEAKKVNLPHLRWKL